MRLACTCIQYELYPHAIRMEILFELNTFVLSCKSYLLREFDFESFDSCSNAVQYPTRFNLNAFKSNSSSELHDARFEHFIEIICGPKSNAVQSSYELNMCLISPGESRGSLICILG